LKGPVFSRAVTEPAVLFDQVLTQDTEKITTTSISTPRLPWKKQGIKIRDHNTFKIPKDVDVDTAAQQPQPEVLVGV